MDATSASLQKNAIFESVKYLPLLKTKIDAASSIFHILRLAQRHGRSI